MIYLDNNATTQVHPLVLIDMLPAFTDFYGNPSSAHRVGQAAAQMLEQARQKVANLLGARAGRILFTSCGTESDNQAILSAIKARPDKKHLITSQVEHPGVARLMDQLETQGYAVTRLGVDQSGQLDLADLEAALRPDTLLVSLMHANNETGVLFPLAEISALVKKRGILLHVDAVQAVGKVAVDLEQSPVDYLALSGHKLHAPKGIGALYVGADAPLFPLLTGGSQEHGLRPGTENVAYAVGLGTACALAGADLADTGAKIARLRNKLEQGLVERIADCRVNGGTAPRLPNTSSLAMPGVNALDLLAQLDRAGICASGGAACHSGQAQISGVLAAMGLAPEYAIGTVRFSLSRFTTEAEIDEVLGVIPDLVRILRDQNPSIQ